MKTLTKQNIDQLANDIIEWAQKHKLGKDWLLFYNGIIFNPNEPNVRKTCNPLDYCEYFSDHFIMGMVMDGAMYRCINDWTFPKPYHALEKILNKYGLYLEHSSYTACEFCNDTNNKVEYWHLPRKKILRIYRPGYCVEEHKGTPTDYDTALDKVMSTWYNLSAKAGDHGGCTIGEYLQFDYKGSTYRMSSQTPYQGELSWQIPLPEIKQMLTDMGAENIHVNYGHAD